LLTDDGADSGEIRLQRHRTSWELHVTVKYGVEQTDRDDTEPTYIGFDVGESGGVQIRLKR
jgi:transposase